MNCSQLTFSLELVSVQSFVTGSKQNHEVEQVLASYLKNNEVCFLQILVKGEIFELF